MKAKEYVALYKSLLETPKPLGELYEGCPTPDERQDKLDTIIAICHKLLKEVGTIATQRNCKCNSAVAAVLKKQEQKWQAVWRQIADPEIAEWAFRGFARQMIPATTRLLPNWAE